MTYVVKLFAGARDLVGESVVEVELGPEPTVASLRAKLLSEHPTLAPLLAHAMFAINADYAREQSTIPDNAEVALIPPVSGG